MSELSCHSRHKIPDADRGPSLAEMEMEPSNCRPNSRSHPHLSTHGSGRARGEQEKQGTWGRLAAGRHAAYAKMPLLPRNGVRAGEGVGSERAG